MGQIVLLLFIFIIFLLFVILYLLLSMMRAQRGESGKPSVWKRIFLSEILIEKSDAGKIAYIGVMAALCIISNTFEFRFADIQFSLTVATSILTGILLGPAYGFLAVFLGDAIGYIVNSWGFIYMPWVGVSVAFMAFLAGLVMKLPLRFKGSGYCKLALICVLTLLICSVGINTTGMYFYYTRIGFSPKALGFITEHFGGVNTYLTYALVRLLFMGQIWNSLFNYVLLFMAVPLLNAAKPLKIKIR